MNNTAFSLLEILLASIIFIISVGGVFATLNAVRTPVVNKESGLTAAIFGKQVLERLRSQVSADPSANFNNQINVCPCTTFDLGLGKHSIASLPSGLSWPPGLTSLTYTVSCGDVTCSNPDAARMVKLDITW